MTEKEKNQEQTTDQQIVDNQMESQNEEETTKQIKENPSQNVQQETEPTVNKINELENMDSEVKDTNSDQSNLLSESQERKNSELDDEFDKDDKELELKLEQEASEIEIELTDAELENENKYFFKRLGIITLIVVILLSAVGLFLFYPFSFKVAGSWTSSNVSGLKCDIKGSKVNFEMPNSNVDGMTIVYSGKLHPDGVNSYRYSDVKVQIKVDKSLTTSDEIKKIKDSAGDAYKVVNDSNKLLTIEYKVKEVNKLFEGYNQNQIATFKGPLVYFPFQNNELTVNCQFLYQDLIQMKEVKDE